MSRKLYTVVLRSNNEIFNTSTFTSKKAAKIETLSLMHMMRSASAIEKCLLDSNNHSKQLLAQIRRFKKYEEANAIITVYVNTANLSIVDKPTFN
jgi:hypothetical protein